MGAHDFENNKGLFLLEKREYKYFDVCCPVITAMKTSHTAMYVPSFIRIERDLDGGP